MKFLPPARRHRCSPEDAAPWTCLCSGAAAAEILASAAQAAAVQQEMWFGRLWSIMVARGWGGGQCCESTLRCGWVVGAHGSAEARPALPQMWS